MPNDKVQLDVFGPIEIPYEGKGKSKRIDDNHIKSFWKKDTAKKLIQKQGCYIFAFKASKGFTPWYVGKATKSFKQECFNLSNRKNYNSLLWEGKKGTPVMFFVALPGTKHKIATSVINDIEKYLIQNAFSKNHSLLNRQNTRNLPNWGIKGIIRYGKGKASKKSKEFKTLMGL